ncbi:MAG: radical SAM protein [Candidatus Omnitrophica bacterium]|nr:radical SAM protein [Candidatus Omnitrophota bacterium]
MSQYKVFIDTACVNCKANSILGSRVYEYLERNDHHIEKSVKDADVIIINTCGFNAFHQNMSENLIKDYCSAKKPGSKLISIGCLNKIDQEVITSIYPDTILISELNELDEIFASQVPFANLTGAALTDERIDQIYISKNRYYDWTDSICLSIGKFLYLAAHFHPGMQLKIKQVLDEAYKKNKFFVEISQGCLSQCSYCVIKRAKGQLRSRPIDHILQDIKRLYDPGKNLCLVAEDCGCYGLDKKTNLFTLMDRVKQIYPDLGVDLCYLNPLWVEKYFNEYIELFKNHKINSVNLSIQSGSDKIIQAMNRKYSVDTVRSFIDEIRTVSPQTLIWTHIIIGFPTETFLDFLKTLNILSAYDISYKFYYDEKKGTPSARLSPKVPRHIKAIWNVLYRLKEIQIYIVRFFSMLFGRVRS